MCNHDLHDRVIHCNTTTHMYIDIILELYVFYHNYFKCCNADIMTGATCGAVTVTLLEQLSSLPVFTQVCVA